MAVPSQHWVVEGGWLGFGVNSQLLESSLPEATPLLWWPRGLTLMENEYSTVTPGTDIRVLFPLAQFRGELHLPKGRQLQG